jgi:hypothetical protein
MSAEKPEGRAATVAELAGKLLTVAGILLPVFGVFARSVAMVSTGISAIPSAVAPGLPELALSGLTPTLVLGLTAGAALSGAAFARRRHVRHEEARRQTDAITDTGIEGMSEAIGIGIGAGVADGMDELGETINRVLLIIVAIVFAIFLPGFPVSIAFVIALFLVLRWSRGLVKRYVMSSLGSAAAGTPRPSIYPLAAVLVISLLLASAWAGLAGFGVGAVLSRYEFEPGGSLSDGTYVRLAETESRIFVMTCGEYRSFEIPADQVRLVEFSPRGGVSAPSLWSVFRGAPIALGLRAQCGNA